MVEVVSSTAMLTILYEHYFFECKIKSIKSIANPAKFPSIWYQLSSKDIHLKENVKMQGETGFPRTFCTISHRKL